MEIEIKNKTFNVHDNNDNLFVSIVETFDLMYSSIIQIYCDLLLTLIMYAEKKIIYLITT